MDAVQRERTTRLITMLREDIRDEDYRQDRFGIGDDDPCCALGWAARSSRFPEVSFSPRLTSLFSFEGVAPTSKLDPCDTYKDAAAFFGLTYEESMMAFGGFSRTRTQQIALLESFLDAHDETDGTRRALGHVPEDAIPADDVIEWLRERELVPAVPARHPSLLNRALGIFSRSFDRMAEAPVATMDRGFDL